MVLTAGTRQNHGGHSRALLQDVTYDGLSVQGGPRGLLSAAVRVEGALLQEGREHHPGYLHS